MGLIPVNGTCWLYSIRVVNQLCPSASSSQITRAPTCAWPMTNTKVLNWKKPRGEALGANAAEIAARPGDSSLKRQSGRITGISEAIPLACVVTKSDKRPVRFCVGIHIDGFGVYQ